MACHGLPLPADDTERLFAAVARDRIGIIVPSSTPSTMSSTPPSPWKACVPRLDLTKRISAQDIMHAGRVAADALLELAAGGNWESIGVEELPTLRRSYRADKSAQARAAKMQVPKLNVLKAVGVREDEEDDNMNLPTKGGGGKGRILGIEEPPSTKRPFFHLRSLMNPPLGQRPSLIRSLTWTSSDSDGSPGGLQDDSVSEDNFLQRLEAAEERDTIRASSGTASRASPCTTDEDSDSLSPIPAACEDSSKDAAAPETANRAFRRRKAAPAAALKRPIPHMARKKTKKLGHPDPSRATLVEGKLDLRAVQEHIMDRAYRHYL